MLITRLTKLLQIELPIIQGGMNRVGYAELASAVSAGGALGQIGTVAMFRGARELRDEIKKLREKTTKPFGVNFTMGHNAEEKEQWLWVQQFLDVVVEESVPVITISGGNPLRLINHLRGTSTKIIVVVSSPYHAQKAEELGADAVIAIGYEAGGHIGRSDVTTLLLVPAIVEVVKIPVIAAGGVANGFGLAAAIALGAEGVQMGSRFMATVEASIHQNAKNALLNAGSEDTLVVEKSMGTPGRMLKGPIAERIMELEKKSAPFNEIIELLDGKVNACALTHGDIAGGYLWAGQSVGLIRDCPSVKELLQRTLNEAEKVFAHLNRVYSPTK